MTTIEDLEERLNTFEQSLIQMGVNIAPTIEKTDETANKVVELTPYTETKTAYIRDTKVVFENVPQGNLSVFGLNEYHVERVSDNIVVTFEPLENVTTVSISIQ